MNNTWNYDIVQLLLRHYFRQLLTCEVERFQPLFRISLVSTVGLVVSLQTAKICRPTNPFVDRDLKLQKNKLRILDILAST